MHLLLQENVMIKVGNGLGCVAKNYSHSYNQCSFNEFEKQLLIIDPSYVLNPVLLDVLK
jgi:hypothetical protein